MLKEYLLVCYKGDLGCIINQPLQSTQRIKFTCFDISFEYMVFGATSGGIYIFKRKPCTFLKLLPSKEGAITNVTISHDEKILAISTSKGLVLISNNPFHQANGDFLVFTEHENNNITAMKWQHNFLYTGDNVGNIAVIDVNTSFTKAIFKVPSASLMLLDSPVIQLDTCSKYLLISTESKTFLCDTEEEHYRQIGKKLRSGDFGCCFLKSNNTSNDLDNNENVKIISARPGCRLWEADFSCQVVRTHQFKESLSTSHSTCIAISESTDHEIEILSQNIQITDFNNFKLLHILDNKFILTFNNKGFYIFDINTVTVIFWICDFDNIKDIKIYKNYIYIWTESSNVILITFTKLEKLLKKTLSNKQFNICTKLCFNFKNDILNLLNNSGELNLIYILKDYLNKKCDIEMLNELNILFNKIEEEKKTKHSSILQNGIHVVTNLKAIEIKSELNGQYEKIKDPDKIDDPLVDINYNLNILYKQYKINNNFDLKNVYKIFDTKDLISIVELLDQFVVNVKKIESLENDEILQLWCYNQILHYIQEKQNKTEELNLDTSTTEYLIQAFKAININKHEDLKCTCFYPLPIVKKHIPKYYNIGCAIAKCIYNEKDCLSNFLENVPYMWKYVLNLRKNEDVQSLLPVIVQFSDEEVLAYFIDKFTYDIWDNSVKLLIKLKNKICLNCEKTINVDNSIDWTKFANLMLENIGSISAIKILTRYADDISSNDLGMEFYQSCIFTTVMNSYKNSSLKQASNFLRSMHSVKSSSNEISSLLNEYLTKKYITSIEANEINTEKKNLIAENCSYCDLPLNCPILKDVTNLNCGHFYHNICIMHLNKICNLCTRLK